MSLNKNKHFPIRPRLNVFEYIGCYAYFITILTKNRNRYFINKDVVEKIIVLLKETSGKENFSIEAFCFMPDHLHLLIKGLNEKSDLKKIIKLFKQKSGYWFKSENKFNLWSLSYYDHVLRKDEAIKDTAFYIFNNPVRKSIVSDYKQYPFSGSFTMDINTLL